MLSLSRRGSSRPCAPYSPIFPICPIGQISLTDYLTIYCNSVKPLACPRLLYSGKQKQTNKRKQDMNLTRWQRPDLATWAGFGRLSDLRDEIDRLFESPLSEFTRASQLLSGWTPALDMHEDKDNVVIVMELPGMKKEDIDISLQ